METVALPAPVDGAPAARIHAAAAAPPAAVFANTPQNAAPGESLAPVIGEFTFRFDISFRQQLDAIARARADQPARILFPVTDNRVVDLAITRHDAHGASRGDVYARVDDREYADAVLSYVDDAVAGTIVTPDGELFQVRYVGNGVHRVAQLDPQRFPDESEPLIPASSLAMATAGADEALAIAAPPLVGDAVAPGVVVAPATPTLAGAGVPPMAGDFGVREGDSTATIDMMIVYTPESRANNGGVAGINAVIGAAVAKTNLAFIHSKVGIAIHLVHTAEVAYTSSGNLSTDLAALQSPYDGVMDNVQTLRATHNADLVSLFVPAPPDGTAGLAYLLNPEAGGHTNWAFSVVVDVYADGNISFAHEVGHNFGCGHGMGDGTGVHGYSNGHRFIAAGQQYRTVMAYAPGIRIPYFSSYSQHYAGEMLGTAASQNNMTLMRGRTGIASLLLGSADTSVAAAGDFNGDNKSDLIWRNRYSGNSTVNLMDGLSTTSSVVLLPGFPEWVAMLTADFNADGKPDIVWRNSSTGQVNVAFMNGTTKIGQTVLLPASGSDGGWLPMLAGDFNGDTWPDILWHNRSFGQVTINYMIGTVISGQDRLWGLLDANWVNWMPLTTADFNGDGRPDIVWREITTGKVVINYMNGLTNIGKVTLLEGLNPLAELPWAPMVAGDFNGDGKPDLVWRNSNTGEVSIWYMNNGARIGKAVIPH